MSVKNVALTALWLGYLTAWSLAHATLPAADASGDLYPLLSGARLVDFPEGGIEVISLDPDSRAARSGLLVGDVVLGANRRRTDNPLP